MAFGQSPTPDTSPTAKNCTHILVELWNCFETVSKVLSFGIDGLTVGEFEVIHAGEDPDEEGDDVYCRHITGGGILFGKVVEEYCNYSTIYQAIDFVRELSTGKAGENMEA